MLLSKWRSLLNLCHLCGFKSPFSVARLQANDSVQRSQMFWIVLMLRSYSFAHCTATIHSGETDSTFSNSICRRCLDLRQSRLLPTVVWTVCRALENDWECLWLFCPEQLPSSCSVRDFGWFRLFDLFSPMLCRKLLLLQGLTFSDASLKNGLLTLMLIGTSTFTRLGGFRWIQLCLRFQLHRAAAPQSHRTVCLYWRCTLPSMSSNKECFCKGTSKMLSTNTTMHENRNALRSKDITFPLSADLRDASTTKNRHERSLIMFDHFGVASEHFENSRIMSYIYTEVRCHRAILARSSESCRWAVASQRNCFDHFIHSNSPRKSTRPGSMVFYVWQSLGKVMAYRMVYLYFCIDHISYIYIDTLHSSYVQALFTSA